MTTYKQAEKEKSRELIWNHAVESITAQRNRNRILNATYMEHLWLELILNQFGHPYHTNVGNHRRYSYKAKTRRMCIDVVTLDKCRALYDWIPMLEYFIHDMQNVNRQMITRMCMDAIDKQLLHIYH